MLHILQVPGRGQDRVYVKSIPESCKLCVHCRSNIGEKLGSRLCIDKGFHRSPFPFREMGNFFS